MKYLADYQAPNFSLESVELTFELDAVKTRVTSVMQVSPLEGYKNFIWLDGEYLELISIKLNGLKLDDSSYELAEGGLKVFTDKSPFELEIVTQINPQENTRLEGLYLSSGNYCTQCEAEGFRAITYFPDRPDVLTLYTTKIIADKSEAGVLLSNGNLVESGDLPNGKHFAVWQDPFPKPSYLFGAVAGNLVGITDEFLAADGKLKKLEIYTQPDYVTKLDHAMQSLKRSMKWDEERFGLIYDLDIYMIVAVDDFNMGAMENKGLNVFNTKFVLADAESATDIDFIGVESVIAHEYFHNWTGNRVTCRDWFQLTLKEGLTVFRDQEFTADMLSRDVRRIEDVRGLRNHQFVEDAGPRAHPIQPQEYSEINNFYTLTIYEKGAEIVRLYNTLLGRGGFRAGLDLYFERHDGQAVTVHEFRKAMADANNIDLEQMHNWYIQSGTPQVKVEADYDAASQSLTLSCEQNLPNSENFAPLLIPLNLGLYQEDGQLINLDYSAIEGAVRNTDLGVVLLLKEQQQQFVISDLAARPLISLLQGFSAPVVLDFANPKADLVKLAQCDLDGFNRWEAMQTLALAELQEHLQSRSDWVDKSCPELSGEFKQAVAGVLADFNKEDSDFSLMALALTLPGINYFIEQTPKANIADLVQTHQAVKKALAQEFKSQWQDIYQDLSSNSSAEYIYNSAEVAKRQLQNLALDYWVASEDSLALTSAEKQYKNAANMTLAFGALEALQSTKSAELARCLADFYAKWKHEPLVLDKWFALQARVADIAELDVLLQHPDFKMVNPNRARSLLAVFGMQNLKELHRKDGAGYVWLADRLLELDKLNPQVAARIITPLTQLNRLDKDRQDKVKHELQRLKNSKPSKDLVEIISIALGG